MRTLLLAAHNDDETLFASYLLLRYQPHVVICLRSERMASPFYPGGIVVSAETREAETEQAMNVFGCSWTQWPIGDTDPDRDQLEAFMWGLRDPSGADDWDIVFAPAIENEGHDQHNLIGLLADLVFSDSTVKHYLTYTYPDGRSRDGEEIEFEPHWPEIKLQALACYQSQTAHPATRAHFLADDHREFLA